jgi:hypothetical protein
LETTPNVPAFTCVSSDPEHPEFENLSRALAAVKVEAAGINEE